MKRENLCVVCDGIYCGENIVFYFLFIFIWKKGVVGVVFGIYDSFSNLFKSFFVGG